MGEIWDRLHPDALVSIHEDASSSGRPPLPLPYDDEEPEEAEEPEEPQEPEESEVVEADTKFDKLRLFVFLVICDSTWPHLAFSMSILN